jgi:hypothetical protein
MIAVPSGGWLGAGALAFLALSMVFYAGFCVPCNVIKIAFGRVGKSWMIVYVQDVK